MNALKMEEANVLYASRNLSTALLSKDIFIVFISMKSVLLATCATSNFGQIQILNVICPVTLVNNLCVIRAADVIPQSNVSPNISAILLHVGLILPCLNMLEKLINLIRSYLVDFL